VLLPGDEEVEFGAEIPSSSDTVRAQALTVVTRAGRFDRAASNSGHGAINSADSAIGDGSVFNSSSCFSPPLVKLLNLRSQANRRLTLAIVHQGDADKVGTEEGEGGKNKVLNLVWFIRAHLGEQAWGDRGFRIHRRALDHRRLRRRTGTTSALALLGQSPSIVSLTDHFNGDSMVLALPAPTQRFVLLALQAQSLEKVPLAENLTCRREATHQKKKRSRRDLSPLSVAVRRAGRLIPEMWEPIQEDCGAPRKDRRAASALMVLSHRALLLEKTIEVFPSVISDRA
jgi:hypothetical protein